MYMTRPLSLYYKFPSARSAEAEAPYSGSLLVTDEEAEGRDFFCCGLSRNKGVTKLPFPQDRILKVVHSSDYDGASATKVWFIPVLDQPLSSNRYYVIRVEGRHKGLACTNSLQDDVAGCCFNNVITDVKPLPFDHRDIYQQFEIQSIHKDTGFYAKSVAGDGFPPKFLRRKGWKVLACNSPRLQIREAQGLNTNLQIPLPNFNFPIYYKCSHPSFIAKWYCPFVFVREGVKVQDQVRTTILYEMTLQQWWEEIFTYEKADNEGENNVVVVDAIVRREAVLVYGNESVKEDRQVDDGFVWYGVKNDQVWKRGVVVGLSIAIFEKMRWLEESRGWVDGGVTEERVVRMEKMNKTVRFWKKFSCYVLVESFVLKRGDGVVLLSCKFRHTHVTQCKWE